MTTLPSPQIVACEDVSLGLDEFFLPEMGALRLHWDDAVEALRPRNWTLPLRHVVEGPAPTRFGIRVTRYGEDQYSVHVVWNRSGIAWTDLNRREIQESDLGCLLAAMGTNLDDLLNQPVQVESPPAVTRFSNMS